MQTLLRHRPQLLTISIRGSPNLYTSCTERRLSCPAACGHHQGSCGQEEADARLYASYGVDFVKDDDCSPCSGSYDADYARMGAAVADSGRPMALMVEGIPDAKLFSTACTGVNGHGS